MILVLKTKASTALKKYNVINKKHVQFSKYCNVFLWRQLYCFLVISVFGGVLMILQNFDAGNMNETEGCFLAGSLVPLLVVDVSSCSGVSKI